MRILPPFVGDVPAEISTELPKPTDVEPARRDILPATPVALFPVPRSIEPVDCIPAPDENSNEPVRPAVDSADNTLISPESPEPTPEATVPPEPDIIETAPPATRLDGPPAIIADAPTPVLVPGFITTLPDRPVVEEPLDTVIDPEPLDASPDETSTGPVVDEDPPESREIDPLEETPLLVVNKRFPPFDDESRVSPVLITTDPPGPTLDFPARIDTAPAPPDVEVPDPTINDPEASREEPLETRTVPELMPSAE